MPNEISFENMLGQSGDASFDSMLGEIPKVEATPDISSIAKEIRDESHLEGGTVQENYMKEFLRPSVEEYDTLKTNPILSEQFKSEVSDTLKGFTSLATQPMEVVRGGAEFVLSLPGFGLGIINAGKSALERMSGPFTINDLYNAASKGMSDMQTYWSEKMVEPLLGQPSRESQIVGQIAMAPALGLSMLGGKISESFEDYPNVQGLLKFAGDIGGLIALGRIYKGSNKDVTAEAERIATQANEIATQEQLLIRTTDEQLRVAQQAILDAKKQQLELEASKIKEGLDYGKMIKEDLNAKRKTIDQIKQKDITPSVDEAIDIALKGKEEVPGIPKADREKILRTEKTEPVTEVDTQTGTREPIELSTEKSPFREHDPERTRYLDETLRPLAEADDPYAVSARLNNDVNRWLDGDDSVDITRTRNMISDIAVAAREQGAGRMTVADAFSELSMEEITNFAEVMSEMSKWARRAERDVTLRREFGPAGGREEVLQRTKELSGTKLFDITQVPSEAAKEVVKLFRSAQAKAREARGIKEFKPKEALSLLKREFIGSIVDKSGNIRKEMLNKLGDLGYNIVQKMYLAKGSSALAVDKLRQMRKEVYGGLSGKEKEILDDLIFHTRIMDIAKYKTKRQFKELEKYTVEEAAAFLNAFQPLLGISPERAYELYHVREDGSIGGRTGAYFEWMKKPLRDMLDAELISQEEFNLLNAHNYRRLKLAEIYDNRYETKVGKRPRNVYDSGVESLARGRETTIFERSSEVMALEVFNRAYGRILNNAANQSLLELARKDPTNPFVRVKENRGDKNPTGWNRIYVYEGGEKKPIYISPEMSKEWIISNPEMSYRISQFIRLGSLSPILRTFATGINWGFALANLPRDVMHTWFAARVFENGKWKPIYNTNFPIFALQMGRDQASVFSDALLRRGRYTKYIEEGGGMEFMVHQGRLFQRGRHLEGPIDKMYDFFGYFGETSELMTRLAIRERVLRRRAKEKGITVAEAEKDPKISKEATFAARDYMDFGQGGGVAKVLDNGIPYLNASIQGTRGLLRAFKDNPVQSVLKLSQLAAVTTGLYIAMNKMAPKTFKDLKGNIDMQNNLCVPLGDQSGFEDEHGQMRYLYFKIPLDPGQKFFKTFFEAATDKWLGNEVDVGAVVNALEQVSPAGVSSLPPSISGPLGYMINKDFWLNEDIWRETDKPFSWPRSSKERIQGETPQAYIDFGELTGLSPERIRYVVEELTTNGTIWSYLLGQAYDALRGLPENKKRQHIAMTLAKMPVIRRFIGITHPYSKHAAKTEKYEEISAYDRWLQNEGLDTRVEGYLYQDTVKRDEIEKYIDSFDDSKVQDRLVSRFEFQEATKNLPNKSFWLRLKGLDVNARAMVFYDEYSHMSPEEKVELEKEMDQVYAAGGVLTDSFWDEVDRLESANRP